ncbi:MAG: hypothetical protein IJ839_07070 [Ruminobacter sp.]|nr:hypothetical protein [Ruminobacter sp.]
MGQKIASIKRSGLSVARVDRNKLDTLYYQLLDLIGESGYDYQDYFARPKDVPSEKSIDWYSDLNGTVKTFDSLSDEQANEVLAKIREIGNSLNEYSEKLSNSGERSSADLVKSALKIPDRNYIYLVGNHPVITCWGFSKSDGTLAQGYDLTGSVLDQLHNEQDPELSGAVNKSLDTKPVSEVSDTIEVKNSGNSHKQLNDGTAPISTGGDEDTQSFSGGENDGIDQIPAGGEETGTQSFSGGKNDEVDPIPTSGTDTQAFSGGENDGVDPIPAGGVGSGTQSTSVDMSEAGNKQGETKKSKWWLYLLILLLLLLFLLLLWWLLMREPNTEKDDFSFLKGTLRVKDVLENEKGQLVDMKLIFKDDSGIGESIIQTSSKTCRGSVHATVAGDNMVRFNLSQLACPDNDNFDSFDMLCNNERTSCLGTIGDGTSWEISPVIEK